MPGWISIMLKKILYIVMALILISSMVVSFSFCQPPVQGKPSQAAVPQQTLNLYGIDPQTLDPAISGDATSHQYVTQIFSGLVSLDDKMEPAPDIAKDWQVSPDGRTYTFQLRQDVKFHDGKPVRAPDFKYSWQRAAAPATHSITAGNYLGDIVGVKDMLAGHSNEISGVRVIDDYTLEVTISSPESYFLSKLTYPTACVVDSSNVKSGVEWWRKPNGTGPFKLKQWDEGSRLVLTRNDLYYGKVALLDSVVFHILSGIPMNLYETGEIDAADVSVSDIDRVTDESGTFFKELTITPELSFAYIGFNTSKPPFDEADIRRAFTLAIDKDKLTSLVFRDMVQKSSGILPPGIPGYNNDLRGLDYNVVQARKLIAESKYGPSNSGGSTMPPITITTSGWGGAISGDLQAVIYQWQQNLDIEVKVRQLEPDRYYYHLKDEKDEMFDMGWVADYPHPQDFLDILFRSGSENNYGGYSNPDVDALLNQAGAQMDVERSLTLYQQAEQKLVTNAAVIPLWSGRNITLVKPYVKNYKVNPLGLVAFNRVFIEAH